MGDLNARVLTGSSGSGACEAHDSLLGVRSSEPLPAPEESEDASRRLLRHTNGLQVDGGSRGSVTT